MPEYVFYDRRFVEQRLIAVNIKIQENDIPPIIVADSPLLIVEQSANESGQLAGRSFIDRIKDHAYAVFAEYPGVIAAPAL